MAKQNGSLNKKFDRLIERLDVLVELMGSVDKTLQRHENQLTSIHQTLLRHDERLTTMETRLTSIESTLKDIRSELLEKVVHYGDRVLLQTESGVSKVGILRE